MKEKRVDIKTLNIPNVCFSLTEKDDEREPKFKNKLSLPIESILFFAVR
jgi:hypothetical protein